MDPIAESLARADAEEEQYQSAKGANLGATATICRWRRRALESFGAGSDIVKRYDEELHMLKELRDRIDRLESEAMKEALVVSKEIRSRFGDKKEREILKEDHIKVLKLDGPK